MKKQLLLLLLLEILSFQFSYAIDFKIDGIYYKSISGSEVMVSSEEFTTNYYSGDIVIPSTVTYNDRTYRVTKIGINAFSQCEQLTSITLPEGLKVIDRFAFHGCSLLDNISIPHSVESILQGAFGECNNITNVYISENITTLDASAFRNCQSMTTIEVSSENPNYSSQEGILFNKERSYLLCYPIGKKNQHYSIPNTVTHIEGGAFSSSQVTSIEMPESLISLGMAAFSDTPLLSITIPEKVTYIGNSVFAGCTNLKTVIYNAEECHQAGDIRYDGNTIFHNCPSLSEVKFGENVTIIPSYLLAYINTISSISLPEGVKRIQYKAFYKCNITSIELPSTLEYIEREAFSYCTQIQSITIPEKVTSIGDCVFAGCTNLKTVIYNAEECHKAGDIGSDGIYTIFYNCPSLSEIKFGENITTIPSCFLAYVSTISSISLPEGVKVILYNAFYKSNITSIELPSTLEHIGSEAFMYCTQIQSITIPENVTYIGMISPFIGCTSLSTIYYNAKNITGYNSGAFAVCSALTSIIIGESVEVIPNGFLKNCTTITSVHIPENVIRIGEDAFNRCFSIESITIPKNIQSVGSCAFSECTSLTTVYLEAEECEYIGGENNSAAFKGCTSLTSFHIGDGVRKIPDCSMYGCDKITSINFPESVTTIGKFAFFRCSSLKEFSLPKNLKKIDFSAFEHCSAIESILFPDSLETININAFAGCILLTTVSIPKNITTLRHFAFSGCSSLSSVFFNAESANFGAPPSSYGPVFYNCDALTSITIGESVKTIPACLFALCTNITSITIPVGVEDIGNMAFLGCSSLNEVYLNAKSCRVLFDSFSECPITTIHIGSLVTRIPSYLFSGINTLSTISIPDNVKSIGSHAFRGCSNLQSITFPERLEEIEEYAFYLCSSLQSITLPESIIHIANSAFQACSSMESINIPKGITEIQPSAFHDCSSLTSIVLPPNLIKINRAAFHGCSSLKSITIPETVEWIDDYAFDDCTSLVSLYYNAVNCTKIDCIPKGFPELQTIVFGKNVETLPDFAFYKCLKLKDIYVQNPIPPVCGRSAFINTSKEHCQLHVPYQSLPLYQSAYIWEGFYNITEEEPTEVLITTTCVPKLAGVVTEGAYFDYLSDIKLEASAWPGYTFSAWMEGDEVVGTSSTYEFEASRNLDLKAVFVPIENGDMNISVEVDQTSVIIRWNEIENASHYNLTLYEDASYSQIVISRQLGLGLSCRFDGLAAGRTYYYELVSKDEESVLLNQSIGSFTTMPVSLDRVEKGIHIYPNPIEDLLYISEIEGEVLLELFDSTGKQLLRQTVRNKEEISLSHLPTGIYILRIHTDDKIIDEKLIKK